MTGRFSEISGRCPPPVIAGFGVSSGRQQLADDLRPSQPDGEMQGPSGTERRIHRQVQLRAGGADGGADPPG